MDDKTKGIGDERTSGRSDEYISGREALDTDGRIGERGTSRIPSRTKPPGAGNSPDTTRNLSSSSSPMDAPAEERTREIRAEIEQTREEMSETVNAIQDRLRPGTIASNAAESVKSTVSNAAENVKSTVRNVAGEKAQIVADRARDMADSEPVQYARANPIPTAMVGIGIAGLAWLALGGREARSARTRYRAGREARDWRRFGPYDEGDRYYRGAAGYRGQSGYTAESGFGDAGFGETGYPGQGGYETAAAYSAELPHGTRGDYAGDRGPYNDDRYSRDRFENRGSAWTDDTTRAAQQLGRRAQETTRTAQRTVQRTWQENPLLMGAASAVLGLMVGMAVPETEIENEYMGEARDTALENVQQTVRETVNKVQDVASSAVGIVTGEQNPPASRGQQGYPPTGAVASAPPTEPQANRPGSKPGTLGQSGSQTPGVSGQPPKNPGIV